MKKIVSSLIGILAVIGCSGYKTLDVNEFEQALQDKGNIQIADVRTDEEYAEGHIDGAVLIDVQKESFMEDAGKILSKSMPVAVYCRTGIRSATAASQLQKAGYEVINLDGGITAWTGAGKPVQDDFVDMFFTPGGKMVRLHCLVHSSVRMEYGSKEIQIDPVRKMGAKEFDYTVYPKPQYIFVTHEHPDHYDKGALDQLGAGKDNYIANPRCTEMAGFGTTMANGDSIELDGISVDAVPAYNYSEGRTNLHPKGRDNGYIMDLDGLRIYFAGDTEDIEEMSSVKNIDIAFFPCNGPTMTVDQLVRAADIVKPKVLFPYHYNNTDVSVIPGRLKDIDVRIRHYE